MCGSDGLSTSSLYLINYFSATCKCRKQPCDRWNKKIICAAKSIRHTNCVFSLAPTDVMIPLSITRRKLVMRIIEPAPMVETSASSTFVKTNYIVFVALSLMSVQAGKIFHVFYELYVNSIQLFRELLSCPERCDISHKPQWLGSVCSRKNSPQLQYFRPRLA